MIREGESRCKEKTRENGLFFGVFYAARLKPHTLEQFALFLRRRGRGRFGRSVLIGCKKSEHGAQFAIQLRDQFRILLEELAGAVSSLPDPLALIAEPGAALLDQVAGDTEIQQIALAGGSLAVEDIELSLAER